MRTALKLAAALTFVGALAAVAVTQSQAASPRRDQAVRGDSGYAYSPGTNAYDAAPFGDDYVSGQASLLNNGLPAGAFPKDCASDLGYGRRDYSAC